MLQTIMGGKMHSDMELGFITHNDRADGTC